MIIVAILLLTAEIAGGANQYGLKVVKKSSSNEVSPGEWINYTISCKNTGSKELTGVQIKELYPQNLEIITTSPHPDAGTDDQWTANSLSPGTTYTIKIKCKLLVQTAYLSYQGRIEGEGFVRINNHLSNGHQSGTVLNQVIATSDQTTSHTASSSVQISQKMVEMGIKKSGSGIYKGQADLRADDHLSYVGSYKSVFKPVMLNITANDNVSITSRLDEDVTGKNRVADITISEEYRYATSTNRSLSLALEWNNTNWETSSEFTGMGHIGVLQKSEPSPSAHESNLIFESEKDFWGRFNINNRLAAHNTKVIKIDLESVPSYMLNPQVRYIIKSLGRGNSQIRYLNSASGIGYVFGLDKVGSSQLSGESGSGKCELSTEIRTYDNYLVKNQSLLYRPSSFVVTESGEWFNQSLKWDSKISSGNNKDRFMGMSISSADRLNEMVEVTGLKSMKVEANFSGRANLVTIFKDTGYRQEYLGNYSVEQRISQKGVVNYNQPHLTLCTEGQLSYLPNRTLAKYAIEMVNDGNCRLEQIELVDIFPKGAEFASSSLEFSELTSSEAKWTVDLLKLGQIYSIELILDVTKNDGDLENKVVASCENSGLQVINTTLLTPNVVRWPSKCCMIKNAWLDSEDKNVIWYSILVSNTANFSQKSLLKDLLPLQTAFVNSSVDPQTIDGRKITWSFQLLPYENWTATYRVEASEEGTRINYAQVELHPPDGSPISVAYAEAEVKVGSGDRYSGEKWRPPDWGLELDMDNCCNLTRNSYLESGCN